MAPLYLTPYLFCPTAVRREVPRWTPGAYVLGHNEGGFVGGYVGRSDGCLCTRLAGHEMLGQFDYFIFRPARDADEAYQFECEIWHVYRQEGIGIRNVIHPGSPRGAGRRCPYCYFAGHVNRLLKAA